MKRVLKTFWDHTRGIRGYGIQALVATILGLVLRDIFRPIAMKNIINGMLVSPDAKNYRDVFLQLGLYVLLYSLSHLFFRIGEKAKITFKLKHMQTLRNEAFRAMIAQSLEFFIGNTSGSLIAKQKRFVSAAEVLFDELTDKYLQMIIQALGVSIVMYITSIPIMFIVIAWIALCLLLARSSAKKRLAFGYHEAKIESRVTSMFADIGKNMATVKAFGTSRRETQRFSVLTQKHAEAFTNAWDYAHRQNRLQAMLSFCIHIGCFSLAILFWMYHGMTSGQVILVSIYVAQLSSCFWDFGNTLKRYVRVITEAQEMVEIIDLPTTVEDYSGALETVSLEQNEASIRFEHVYFCYEPSSPLFVNFSLYVPAGQKIAIVGSTGGGKSTLTKLLLRNADPQSGSVFIGPYNIRTDVTQDGFKSCISIVPQSIGLFNTSISENIAYGKPEASSEEIMSAAKKAFVHDFIMSLPYGYDTIISENGKNFSGGQCQRIAIARAILTDKPIMIFDEATSSVDTITEGQIQKIIENDFKEKTVIIIAHRLSTIRNADRILVMENGRIIQDGNHATLAANTSGLYYRMLHSHEVAEVEEVYG